MYDAQVNEAHNIILSPIGASSDSIKHRVGIEDLFLGKALVKGLSGGR